MVGFLGVHMSLLYKYNYALLIGLCYPCPMGKRSLTLASPFYLPCYLQNFQLSIFLEVPTKVHLVSVLL